MSVYNFLAGFTKNECVCDPKDDYTNDDDERLVEEWRSKPKRESVQSPIELKHDESNIFDFFGPLEFHGHWENDGSAVLNNNGYTATLKFVDREMPVLIGGPLHEERYVFEQLHFHWGQDDHSGCEHIFEGKAFSMEAHAVHYNSKYGSFEKAVAQPDGLAVVAFFLQATADIENADFTALSEAVLKIIKIDSIISINPDCLNWCKDEAQCKGYYTYQGSLTTEPYNESVTWIIYPNPIDISKEQVNCFRQMKSTTCEKHNITKNVRPLQTPDIKKLELIYARSHRMSF